MKCNERLLRRPPGLQWKRDRFRKPITAAEYNQKSLAGTTPHFSIGFLFTYVRDSNYQMYLVVQLSRWWIKPVGRAVILIIRHIIS